MISTQNQQLTGNRRPEIFIVPTLGTGARDGPLIHIIDVAVVISLLDAPNDPDVEVQQSVVVAVRAAQSHGREGIVGENAGGAEVEAVVGGGIG